MFMNDTFRLVLVSGSAVRTNRSISVLDLLGTSSICGSYQRHCIREMAILLIIIIYELGLREGDLCHV